jgi:L,D-transpeptidase YcbB
MQQSGGGWLVLPLAALLATFPAAMVPVQQSAAAQSAAAPDPLRAEIATALTAYRMPARASSVDYGAAAALPAVYAQRGNAPLWSRDGVATAQAQALVQTLQHADSYGLEPGDYGGKALAQLVDQQALHGVDARRGARFDVQLSAATLRFMSDLHYGRVKPGAAGFNLQALHDRLDLPATLEDLAAAPDPGQALARIEPPFHHYVLLKNALARYLELAQHPQLRHLPAIKDSLKPGNAYPGAAALRHLLTALGDMPGGSIAADDNGHFTAELSSGVRAFQQRHGMSADGVLGRATYLELTTPFRKRVRQIDLTLERWRWLPPFATPPIIVNIPQFRLFAFRSREDRFADILQMDVIVGKTYPRMQTPVFEADMRYVVFRPYWDIPSSILRNEMLPKIRANPGYLAAQRLEIVNGQGDNSPVVPASPQAIEGLAAGRYRLRQMPGADNALGLVKFMFPNNYNVYLHSTPAHRLFKETVRTFSHGCIRVSDPLGLATDVLRDEPGDWTGEKIDATMNGDKTVRVNLQRPITVLILYGTALATEAGPILFFKDIYGYDRKLEQRLGLASYQ